MGKTFTTVDEIQEIVSAIEGEVSSRRIDQSLGDFLVKHFGMEKKNEARYLTFARFARLCDLLVSDVEKLSLSEKRAQQLKSDATRITEKLIAVGPNFTLNGWKSNFDQSFLGPLNYIAMTLEG